MGRSGNVQNIKEMWSFIGILERKMPKLKIDVIFYSQPIRLLEDRSNIFYRWGSCNDKNSPIMNQLKAVENFV